MYTKMQIQKIPKDLGLYFELKKPEGKGALRIIVKETIEYIPYSNRLNNLKTGEKKSGGLLSFKAVCEQLAYGPPITRLK